MATIDERLEALTHNLELFSHDMDGLKQVVASLADRTKERDKLMDDIMVGTARLLRSVEAHEERINQHGDRLNRLED